MKAYLVNDLVNENRIKISQTTGITKDEIVSLNDWTWEVELAMNTPFFGISKWFWNFDESELLVQTINPYDEVKINRNDVILDLQTETLLDAWKIVVLWFDWTWLNSDTWLYPPVCYTTRTTSYKWEDFIVVKFNPEAIWATPPIFWNNPPTFWNNPPTFWNTP